MRKLQGNHGNSGSLDNNAGVSATPVHDSATKSIIRGKKERRGTKLLPSNFIYISIFETMKKITWIFFPELEIKKQEHNVHLGPTIMLNN